MSKLGQRNIFIRLHIKNDHHKDMCILYFLKRPSFITEFSLPIKSKPIPKWTVKVFFYLKMENNEVKMEFRFENDSLIHRPDRTLRVS